MAGNEMENTFNPDRDDEWKKLEHIKCPIRCSYMATIAEDTVHLFTEIIDDDWLKTQKAHYSLPISHILGNEYTIDEREKVLTVWWIKIKEWIVAVSNQSEGW